MKRYKFIGTEAQLVEHGFEINGIEPNKYADKNYANDLENSLYISLSENYKAEPYREVSWNLIDKKDDITLYIQDLIDANLVEVVE